MKNAKTKRLADELQSSQTTTLHLFAGAGGGILADVILGHRCVGAVEIVSYRRKVLQQRQREGILPWFPIFPDVQTFDGSPWKGKISILSGGFPCQDISSAGKGAGIRNGKRSGLWSEFARIIGEIEPPFVFIENSPLLVRRGLDKVLSDLASNGYSARWLVLGAWHLGARHKRDRIWILAHRDDKRHASPEERQVEEVSGHGSCRERGKIHDSHTKQNGRSQQSIHARSGEVARKTCGVGEKKCQSTTPPASVCKSGECPREMWDAESRVARIANGMANQLDRIAAVGDGQIPVVAATAFKILSQGLFI